MKQIVLFIILFNLVFSQDRREVGIVALQDILRALFGEVGH